MLKDASRWRRYIERQPGAASAKSETALMTAVNPTAVIPQSDIFK